MADNEDDSGATRTITVAEPPGAAAQPPATLCTQPGDNLPSPHTAQITQPGGKVSTAAVNQSGRPRESSQPVSAAEGSQLSESVPAGSGTQLDLLPSCPEEQSILLGTEFTDLANTTIIYVQPDGSLVEGSGLTAEEQQTLLEQLTKQQVVQVSDTEAAQLLQQSQLVRTVPVHNTALDPSQLQRVINQVTKSQQQVQVPQQHLKQQVQVSQQHLKQQVQVPQQHLKQQVQVPQQHLKQQKQVQVSQQNLKTTSQNNASQQLKSVAQQVALQAGSSIQVVQKKSEPVRIQIQVPPKQEVKAGAAPQQNSVAISHPQVKLSANGSVSSAQIIHIQPVVGQQGQQFFLQPSPGDPPIQLLLQSPTPVVGSLLPLVHKLTGQTTSVGAASSPGQKSATSPIRVQMTSSVKSPSPSVIKPPPSTPAKTVSIPLTKTPANGMTTAAGKSSVKPPAIITAVAVQTATPTVVHPVTVTTPPVALTCAVKDKEKEKEKKVKKREKKAVKVQTRSGRVSRPPKYKAKDYKFIKTEDLADSHQSDSDDYSDMSVEEEEGEGGRKESLSPGSSPSLTYSHKSRSHHCQTCDKAYIGPGGLNRHYKLNPTHGDPDPSGVGINTPSNTPRPLRDNSQSAQTTSRGVREEEEKKDDKPAAVATNRAEGGPAAAVGLRGLHHRGPGRPRGRGRGRGRGQGRGRSLGPPPKVTVGLMSRRGRRGRPPKLGIPMVTAEQQAERRRDRLQELVEQCEDEELMDIVLPRLTKVLSLWELLLAKVESGGPTRTRFPHIYREFESLQAQVRQAAQDYISSPQGGAMPLEVRNIEVARSLGILDEVNRMKVVPGASSSSALTNKNVRYMENSKMLPPSKRFKMENSVPVHQNGIETPRTGGASGTPVNSSLKSCSVSVAPLLIPSETKLLTTSAKTVSTQVTPPATPMEVTPGEDQVERPLPERQDQVLSTTDIAAQMKELEKALGSSPESTADTETPECVSVQTPESGSTQTPESSLIQTLDSSQSESGRTEPCEAKELLEGQEIYIQTDGLTVQLAEPGSDGIVIVNGPDGTTMHIQTPEGVPLEAVQALLGIEASDGVNLSKP